MVSEVEIKLTSTGDIHVAPDLLYSVIDKREYVEVHRDCEVNRDTSANQDFLSSNNNGRCGSEDFEFL